ncbi:MAG: hypothetical protein JNJ99_11640, partial [Crocinitomicaceae bacterium]|nr:hypothetical protein [Crocinitomicaceae bacterium]
RIYNYSNFDPITLNSLENQSTFTNCEFRTTGPLNDVNYQPFVHAMLYQCGGVTFRGCDFINEDLNYYDELHRGMGILSIKNKLTVIPACSLPSFPCISPDDPNQFSNLTYGIYSVAGLSLVGFESNGNNFINNRTGIYVGGIVGSKIINNHFEVLRSDFSNIITNQTSGVYLNGCTKYKVEGNSFSDFDDPMVPDGNTRGIVVNNSGENYNEIYRNTFDDLTVGGQSQKINANNFIPGVTFEMKPKGLEWKCNNFSTNIEVDLYVSSGRINFYQGYDLPVSDPNIQFAGARNVFNQEPGDYEIVTESLVNMFLYTHYYDIPTIPINTLGNSFNVQIPTAFNYTQSCPNKIVALYGTSVLYGKKDQLKNEIQELENLVDGGNTSELIQAINSESNGSVKNLLLSNSPYLSDEVLLAYLASNPPAGHMFQVFSANSPLSDLVMQELNATNYPNGVIQNIVSLQNGISDMEYLTYEINYLNSERSEVIDELIRYYMYDTLIVDPMDSIINILVEEDDLERKEELCDAYIIKGDLSNATIIRNQIITEFGSSNYTDLAEININTRFLDDPIASANADSVMHSTLTSIANDPIDKRICPRGEGMLYEHIYSQVIIHDIEDLILPGMAPKSMQTNEGNNQKIQQ